MPQDTEMAAGLPTIASQQPVDLGGGFEDPMDPCTMCMQGQQEIQQAYNELTQSCNACQTQQNLTNLQQQGCQGCAQAQQVIQKVQQQQGGCASCGTQQTNFQQMMPQFSSQQQMPQFPQNTGLLPQQTSQVLVQPMLTPLTGTGQNILTTVGQQPGMVAGQLPISIERGATSQEMIPTVQQFVNGQLMRVPTMTTQQPMISGMVTPPTTMPMQPAVMAQIPPPPQMAMPMQPVVTLPPPAPMQQPVQQPVFTPPPAPVQQPVMQPVSVPTAAPVQLPSAPAPVIQSPPALTPSQIAGLQAYAASISRTGTPAQISITGPTPGGQGGGFGAGPGKGLTGQGTQINLGPEGFGGYQFQGSGGGLTYGGTGGGATGIGGLGGAGGPGAFDVHRPDLHAGGGWHNTLPLGALQNVFNLY